MKRLVLFFLWFPVYSHAQWCIDFEDKSLIHWKQARDSTWKIGSVEPLSGQYSMQHAFDDSVANHDQIALELDPLVLDSPFTSWTFRVRHGYPPSSANHWAVFLAADGNQKYMLPSGNLNAYVLGVNFKGSDDRLKLWKMGAGSIDIVATTSLDWQEEIGNEAAYLNVERRENGNWQIRVDRDSRNPWELIGEGRDSALVSPDYFGIYYRYSSNQDRKFWFDDLCIAGLFKPDTLPPSVESVEPTDANSILLTFSERLNPDGFLVPENYLLVPSGIIPDSVLMISAKCCRLVFGEPFPDRIPLTLNIYHLEDRNGNTASDLQVDFLYFIPGPRDIVFNEIMFDPSPAVGLPALEYIELYNRNPFPAPIGGWTIGIGKTNFLLPKLTIPGGSFPVLGFDAEVNPYGSNCLFMGLFTSRTSLPNAGDTIKLLDRDSNLIDWLVYGPKMHDHEYHADGGWALEQVDPDRRCMHPDNWATSKDQRGGTPGQKNSINRDFPDRSSPVLANLYLPDTSILSLEFNEGMDPASLANPLNYLVDHGLNNPSRVACLAPENRVAILHFPRGFEPGLEYQLRMSESIADCSGLPVSAERVQRFALPLQPERNDILLSEVLFDPRPFCPRFIEVHNPGDKTFDLADLRLAGRNLQTGEIEVVSGINGGHRLFFPGEYLALTEDPDKLMDCCYVHDRETLVRWKNLPAMDVEEGRIVLLDKQLQELDGMSYDLQMHYPMLLETEGVSLERMRFDIPANHRSNWHSAAATEGYATPGRINSHNMQSGRGNGEIEIKPEIFTPDQDGHDDFVAIHYRFPQPGTMATIMVLDPRGRIIKKIADNQLLGSGGLFTWNGDTGQGQMARTGIYLVYVRVFEVKGTVRHYKKTCVLSRGSRH